MVAGVNARRHKAAVEQHGCGFGLHGSACPQGGADTHAAVAGAVVVAGSDAGRKRVEGIHHHGVAVIAAGREQHTRSRVDANEVTVLGVLRDGARHAACLVLLEFDKRSVEVDGVPGALDGFLEHDVARLLPTHACNFLLREEVHGVLLGAVLGPMGRLAARKPKLIVVGLGRGNASDEVMHGCRLVDPHAHNTLVALAAGIAADFGKQLAAVDRLATSLLGSGRIDGSVPVTRVLHHTSAFDEAEVETGLGSVGACSTTRIACTHDEDVGIPGLRNGCLVDDGLSAQPVISGLIVPCGDGSDNLFTLCLRDACSGSGHSALTGEGCAGDDVDRAVLVVEKRRGERLAELAAHPRGLARHVDGSLGDGRLIERKLNGDGTNACAGRSVGARNIARGIRQGSSNGTADSSCSHNSSGTLNKIPAIDHVMHPFA